MDMIDKLKEYLDNATQEELQETYNELSHLLCKDNSTIAERAERFADCRKLAEINSWGRGRLYGYDRIFDSEIYAYERGAAEQEPITRKATIEKACEVYCKMHCNADTRQMCYLSPILRCTTFEVYKRALEE